MQITIEIKCPPCHSPNITGNGKKNESKHRILIRNYLRKDCGRQFISDHGRACRGTFSRVKNMIKI
ncbi:MAG: IS1 family transposase, partial [Treponema sp.]|nr:IS1 family transposase [Treponema sp.]